MSKGKTAYDNGATTGFVYEVFIKDSTMTTKNKQSSSTRTVASRIALLISCALIIASNMFHFFTTSRASKESHSSNDLDNDDDDPMFECPPEITVIRGGLDPPEGQSGFGSYFFVEICGMIEDELKQNNTNFVIVPRTDNESSYFPRRGNLRVNKWSEFFQPINRRLLMCLENNDNSTIVRNNIWYNLERHLSRGRIKAWPYGGEEAEDYGEVGILNATWYTHNRQRGHAVVSQYHVPRPFILNHIDQLQSKLFHGLPVLGIHMRGTDKLMAGGRSVIEPEEYMTHILAFYRKFPSGHVFVATDDADMLATLRESGLKFSSQAIQREVGNRTIPFKASHPQGPKQLGIDIMTDIYLLSRCNFLLHGVSSVVEAVMYLNMDLNEKSINLEYEHAIGRPPWDKYWTNRRPWDKH